ncbi:cytosine permease [Bacillus swezeyi]|uniref:cytosine permease n=1 Tax=Bacillus swezeyi TaxID=1925020 RepID=UPI002E1F154E|nr:cytosine permease [Bacillus swezeyi]
MRFGIQAFAGSTADEHPAFKCVERLERHRRGIGTCLAFIYQAFCHLFSFGRLLVLHPGMEPTRKLEVWAGPLVYLVFGGMVWWALDIAGGIGPLDSHPGILSDGNGQ